jgi:hypothetical protein
MSLNRTWVEGCGLGCCEGYWDVEIVHNYQHQRKPFNGHYPAKKEAKVLRRIMSQTGLTEAEVRSRKKYRKMLSDTQVNEKVYAR